MTILLKVRVNDLFGRVATAAIELLFEVGIDRSILIKGSNFIWLCVLFFGSQSDSDVGVCSVFLAFACTGGGEKLAQGSH